MRELHRGRNIWDVTEGSPITAESVYEDLETLVFSDEDHLRDFSRRYGYKVVTIGNGGNT